MTRTHAVTALVQNESGTINRVVSLFRRRGFSLESFNAGDCEEAGFSRMTFLVKADDRELHQVLRQLDKLIDVVECEALEADDRIMREVALVSFDLNHVDRASIERVASEFEAKTEFDENAYLVLQYTGPVRLVEAFIQAVTPLGVTEIVRTGPAALKVKR